MPILVTPHTVQIGFAKGTRTFGATRSVEFAPLSKAARMGGMAAGQFVTRVLNILDSFFFYSTHRAFPFYLILLGANILQTDKAFVVFVGHGT